MVLTLAGPASSDSLAPRSLERTVHLMGTSARFQVYAPTREQGLAMLERAVGIVEATEDELSTWRPHSDLTTFNHHPVGVPWTAGRHLCDSFADLARWGMAVAPWTFGSHFGERLRKAWARPEHGWRRLLKPLAVTSTFVLTVSNGAGEMARARTDGSGASPRDTAPDPWQALAQVGTQFMAALSAANNPNAAPHPSDHL